MSMVTVKTVAAFVLMTAVASGAVAQVGDEPFLDVGIGDLLFLLPVGLFYMTWRRDSKTAGLKREADIREVTEWRTLTDARLTALETRRDEDRSHNDTAHDGIRRAIEKLDTDLSEAISGAKTSIHDRIDKLGERVGRLERS